MGKTCKYYKEKQLVSFDNGNTWQPTGLTRRGELYESDSTDCGYMTQYKWEVVSGYVCDVTTYTKYEKTQKFQSLDGGQTWEAVVPALYGRGNVLENNSTDCGWTPPSGYSDVYLTFIPISASTKFGISSMSSQNSVSYSLDEGATWTPLANYELTPSVRAGQKIMWKGILNETKVYYGICRFSSTNKFNVEGNIMSLIYGDNFRSQTNLSGKPYAFYGLFQTADVVNCENLILPATTLADSCYSYMFGTCISLQTAPSVLPATALTEYCYHNMFLHCTSLETVPTNYLPATRLAQHCYEGMFRSCTSLTTAPQLPATTLAEGCYISMFDSCSSLTVAPQLQATTMAKACYAYMFRGCTSLTVAPQLPATRLAQGCYQNMFDSCWNLTTPPVLSSTTLANTCYAYMFQNCSGMTTAPVLPATTLTDNCYNYMFYNCSNLTSIICLATNISAPFCTRYWVTDVSSSGTFTKASSMNSWGSGEDGIPNGWTVQNY